MTIEELEAVCKDAARDLAARETRPLPAAVVLPLPDATRIITLPDFPPDDPTRFDLVDRLARDRASPLGAPCYGFAAEATLAIETDEVDVVVVVFGARNRSPRVTAAPIAEDGLGDFAETEDLDPAAMPFLSPLQHAVDAATPPDAAPPILPN